MLLGMRGTPQPQTIQVPPLCLRADITSVDDDTRTFELTFSTGAAVERMDWWTGKRYLEKLSMKPEHIRLGRLNAGAPLLDAHSAWSITDQIGVVVDDSAQIVGGKARAKVRFSKRESVAEIVGDVRDKVVRNVSVGYRVHKFEEDAGKDNKIPVRTAIDWEPFEISMVPMPADTGAQVRGQGQERGDTNPCVIVTRAGQETTMLDDPNPSPSETLVERNPLDPGAPLAPRLTLATPHEPTDHDRGADAERTRIQGLMAAARHARLPISFAEKWIADKTTLLDGQRLALEECGKRDVATIPRVSGPSIQMGDDPQVHVRAGMENALLHRANPEMFKLEDHGRQYRGLTLLDTARIFLQAQGHRTTSLTRMELAGLAMGLNTRGGMHTSSDFANLLADVASKSLRRAYEVSPQTFSVIGRRVTLPDFKAVKRLSLGEAPGLKTIDEQGEFTRGTIGEGKEEFQLTTYGRIFAITRKAIVNDDTDAFSRVPTLFGRAARNLESDVVWVQILANPNMGDGVALFATAHGNLAGTPSIIDIANVGIGRSSMRKQLALDAVTVLNLSPKFLIVCPEIETVADQFVSVNLLASQASNVNPFAGKLTVVTEPRLSLGITIDSTLVAGDVNAWYLSAAPDQVDILEYGSLEGEEGPMVESRVGFDVDGLEIKCRHDFAAKVIDHRGLYKNAGA